VDFSIRRGELHALVGENGAGKSTLMKILSGVYPSGSYEGSLLVEGKECRFASIRDSERAGIGIIFQELALARNISIAENIFLGNEIAHHGVVAWNKTMARARSILEEVGLSLDPGIRVGDLGVGMQQLVEIAKALSRDSRILILDEPTAALTESEVEILFGILARLKKRGVTCIYISHKLSEIFRIADRVTVLRDGCTIGTRIISECSEALIIADMVGRPMKEMYPWHPRIPGDVLFEVEDWTVAPETGAPARLSGISMRLRRNEIVGIAGLMGSGRTEFARSLVGAYGVRLSGSIRLRGAPILIRNPGEGIKAGICYLPEDRKTGALNLLMDIRENTTLAALDSLSRNGVLDRNREIKESESYVRRLGIKTPSVEKNVGMLSGGNQQKVALAKWMLCSPSVLILDEPTRGIDVGAKYEIYTIINDLADAGVCVLVISSELPEVIGLCDRILVMSAGRIAGECSHESATQEAVMTLACKES
jgi:D-xylose transport system ATP-binding protein